MRLLDRLLKPTVARLVSECIEAERVDALYRYRVHSDPARLTIHPTAVVNNAIFNTGGGRIAVGEYVFPGVGGSGHVVELKRAWRRICKAAGITGLRIHDLRHSYASQAASGGTSLLMIGALLGHSNPATTHRYAHLFDDPLRAATERVGAAITAAGQPTKEPTPLKRRGR